MPTQWASYPSSSRRPSGDNKEFSLVCKIDLRNMEIDSGDRLYHSLKLDYLSNLDLLVFRTFKGLKQEDLKMNGRKAFSMSQREDRNSTLFPQ